MFCSDYSSVLHIISLGSVYIQTRREVKWESSTKTKKMVSIKRKTTNNQIYPPHSFSQSSLYPPTSPNSRAPLLGPPNKVAKQIDAFHLSSSDPLDHIFNPGMSRAFVNQMGRIRSRAETGLTWKNQRKVGKLVRRARAMGLISRWTDRSPSDEFR
jgi:ribosomal protein S18